jgi:chromosome segregation ATPase
MIGASSSRISPLLGLMELVSDKGKFAAKIKKLEAAEASAKAAAEQNRQSLLAIEQATQRHHHAKVTAEAAIAALGERAQALDAHQADLEQREAALANAQIDLERERVAFEEQTTSRTKTLDDREADLNQRSAQLTRDLAELEARSVAFDKHLHKIADFARR